MRRLRFWKNLISSEVPESSWDMNNALLEKIREMAKESDSLGNSNDIASEDNTAEIEAYRNEFDKLNQTHLRLIKEIERDRIVAYEDYDDAKKILGYSDIVNSYLHCVDFDEFNFTDKSEVEKIILFQKQKIKICKKVIEIAKERQEAEKTIELTSEETSQIEEFNANIQKVDQKIDKLKQLVENSGKTEDEYEKRF